jgi:hypothetical protein
MRGQSSNSVTGEQGAVGTSQGVFMQYRNGIFAPYSAFSHNIANDYTADEKTKLSRVPNTVLSNIGLSEYTDSQIGISRAFTMLNDNTGEQTNAFYLNSATTTTAGVMTAADKAKLSKVNGNVYYATTATAATTTTKVVEGLPEGYVPVKGDTLYLKWNVANSVASPTLSINGAVYPLQFRTANLTSAIQYSIPINQITMLVYTNTSWEFPYLVDWIDNDTISNTNIGINTLISGEVTTQYKLVMKALDGKLYPLCIGDTTNPTKTVSAQAFDLSSPVFWKISTSSTAAGDKIGTALYYEYAYNNANVQYAFNGFTSADFNKQLYLVGTIEGGGFRLDNSSATSWYTTAIPTSEDGKAYKPFGFIGDAANQFNLVNTGELFEFKNGVFAPVCGSGNIPTYNTIPTNKKEELIFVVGIGFMEWNTAVSPNAYVKNLVLTTSDLNSFANGGSVKLTANAIRDVTITSPIYPVFREVGLLNGQVSGIVGMGEVRSIVTDINPAANYIFARSGQIKLRFKIERRGSGTLRNVTIYKNDTSIYSGNTNGTYDINVTFVKGDRLRFSYSSTAGIVPYLTEFMPYASLDSIAEGAICTPTKQIYKYTIVVTPYDGGGA